uniref:THAP-type domain-containing protein n=1 Tax=Amblyomma aureolatum TaxID=187763 RepID=A0A1E1XE44_9ACAR
MSAVETPTETESSQPAESAQSTESSGGDGTASKKAKRMRGQTVCYAPGCRSGQYGAPKASLFTAPRDEKLRKIWQYNLRRLDKPLTVYSSVCERHFDPRFIERDYVHIVNGDEVRIPRGRPRLAPGAIPTLLPDLPGYLSKKLPRPRPTKGRPELPAVIRPPKPRKSGKPTDTDHNQEGESQGPTNGEPIDTYTTGTVQEEPRQTLQHANRSADKGPLTVERLKKFVKLPSQEWCAIGTLETMRVVFTTSLIRGSGEGLEILHPKYVSFSNSDETEVVAEAYFQGALCCKAIVTTVEEAETFLQDAHATHMCRGAMWDSEFAEICVGVTKKLLQKIGKNDEDTVFSLECTRNVDAEGAMCVPCRLLRKTLLTRKSRVRSQVLKKKREQIEEPDIQQAELSCSSSAGPEQNLCLDSAELNGS